jgi:hemolysin activation/secretion protein
MAANQNNRIALALMAALAASQGHAADVADSSDTKTRNIQKVAPQAPAQDSRFVLRSVRVEGATAYSTEELNKPFAPLIGQEIAASRIFEIASELTARYRRDGNILSQVVVPEQNISEGNVRLVAVEGFIDAVQVRGERSTDDAVVASHVKTLQAARPLTSAVLERELLLMNDLGQSSARGTLAPSAQTPGAADLVVDLARERAAVSLGTNNRNSRSLGPRRVTLDLEYYGALASWDHISLQGGSSLNDELGYAGLAYGGLLGHSGAQWNVGVTGVRSKPGKAANLPDDSNLKTESLSAVAQVSYPLLRSRSRNLYARASLTSFDGQSELLLEPLSDDRIRAVRVGLAFDAADRGNGIDLLDVEVSQGLNSFGARETGTTNSPLSRINGNTKFTKLSVYAARLQSFGADWSGLLAITAQHAFSTLLAPELFAYGGELFGRGYDAAELVGDSGIAAKLELRYTLPIPQLAGIATPYTFYDWGRVERRDPLNEAESAKASSWGAGVRFSGVHSRVQSFIEYAAPIDLDVAAEGNRDARVFAGLQIQL